MPKLDPNITKAPGTCPEEIAHHLVKQNEHALLTRRRVREWLEGEFKRDLEKAEAAGYAKGNADGLKDGYDDGYAKGTVEAYDRGFDDGVNAVSMERVHNEAIDQALEAVDRITLSDDRKYVKEGLAQQLQEALIGLKHDLEDEAPSTEDEVGVADEEIPF